VRRQFAKKLCEQAQKDNSLVLLVGDIGYGVFEEYKSSFPDRYFNVGIAEQNSIGLMSGLSKEGFFPIFFTIIPFLIYRPLEFIRNDLLINERSGLLVGVGAGLAYGALGPTHHAVEDLAVCRALPSLSVYAPSTINSLEHTMDNLLEKQNGITYLRLSKREEIRKEFDRSLLGKGIQITGGGQTESTGRLVVLSYGDTTLGLLDTLKDCIENESVIVLSLEKLQPLPEDELLQYLSAASKILVVEEQLDGSGIYGPICEFMYRNQIDKEISLVNLGKSYVSKVGSSVELLSELSLTGPNLKKLVEGLV
jgi:transketolase